MFVSPRVADLVFLRLIVGGRPFAVLISWSLLLWPDKGSDLSGWIRDAPPLHEYFWIQINRYGFDRYCPRNRR